LDEVDIQRYRLVLLLSAVRSFVRAESSDLGEALALVDAATDLLVSNLEFSMANPPDGT
jgi:hypothetical protein